MDRIINVKRKKESKNITKFIHGLDWNKLLFAFYFPIIIPLCFAFLCYGLDKVWLQIMLFVLIAVTNKAMSICIWTTATFIGQVEICIPYISTGICLFEWGLIVWLTG